MKKYINRYNDVYTFTEDINHDILWEGDFKWCRFGFPNDYTEAYEAYCNDVKKPMSLEKFKNKVHSYDDIQKKYVYDKYIVLVGSLTKEIEMVDPSGGPYICRNMPMNSFGFKDYIVKDFERIDTGYKIITEKCPMCHLAGAIHKLSCSTKKIIINIMENDENLGLYD